MSHSTSGTGPGGTEPQVRQFDPVNGPGARGAGVAPAPTVAPGRPHERDPLPPTRQPLRARRRPPVWLLALIGVVLVALVVVAVLLLRPDPVTPEPEVLEPEVVTLTLPTPTIEPIARETGSALFESLPSTVLGYALTEVGAHPPLIASGALEAHRMVYSDGGATSLTLVAGQWAVPEAAAAASQGTVAAHTADANAVAADIEEGAVLVAGAEVGRYTFVPRADGSGSLTWTNGTVLLEVTGPAAALRDFHTAFTL